MNACYQSIKSVIDSHGNVYVDWMPHLDKWFFTVIHRNINLIESLFYYEAVDAGKVLEFVHELNKAIDYYLDAIWC